MTDKPAPVIHDEAFRLLREVYSALWTEAYYDPYSEDTKAFARPLVEKMKRVGELLGFRG